MKKNTLLLFSLILFSCSPDKQTTEKIMLPLSGTLSKTNVALQDKINFSYRLIKLETSDSVLIDYPFIEDIKGDRMFFKSQHGIYSFSLEDGKFISKFAKKGDGPHEYNSIVDMVFSEKDNSMYILDYRKHKIFQYSEQGKPLKEIENNRITSFGINKENQFVAAYDMYNKEEFQTGVYDENFNHLASFIHNSYDDKESVTLRKLNTIHIFNGNSCIYTSDTLFQVTAEKAEPILAIDKGRYKIPVEIESDASKGAERDKYIWGDYGYLSGNYFFFFFYYNQNSYFDLWDIESRELKTRREVGYQEALPFGIPFEINGEVIYLWPRFASYNKIYCVPDPEQTLKLLPDYDTDDNPVVIEITLE